MSQDKAMIVMRFEVYHRKRCLPSYSRFWKMMLIIVGNRCCCLSFLRMDGYGYSWNLDFCCTRFSGVFHGTAMLSFLKWTKNVKARLLLEPLALEW